MLIVRDDTSARGRAVPRLHRWLVVQLPRDAHGARAGDKHSARSLYVCSAFDVEYHHVVFNNIKDVLSVQASKVFKFEEQEELHNNIIDKGLLKLCQANLKRAEVMAQEFPDVPIKTQILVGKPFQVVMQWAEEMQPSLLVLARHGAHRIEGTELGSQADNLVRLAPCNVLLIGTVGVRPEDIPWIEEDGVASIPWAPEAEVRILRVPPFAQGIARKAVEEFVRRAAAATSSPTARLDEAIRKLLPTHMQLIMGIGTRRGDRARRGEGRGADEADEDRGARRGPGARRRSCRGQVSRSPGASSTRPRVATDPDRRGPTRRGRACSSCR